MGGKNHIVHIKVIQRRLKLPERFLMKIPVKSSCKLSVQASSSFFAFSILDPILKDGFPSYLHYGNVYLEWNNMFLTVDQMA